MAKVTTASTTTNSTSVRTDHPGYLIDSCSKSVIGRPVESFSNIVATDRIIKEACNIGGAIQPSFQRLLLELSISCFNIFFKIVQNGLPTITLHFNRISNSVANLKQSMHYICANQEQND
jgi:hypothetical protein